jgi:hypothetical protein
MHGAQAIIFLPSKQYCFHDLEEYETSTNIHIEVSFIYIYILWSIMISQKEDSLGKQWVCYSWFNTIGKVNIR